MSLGVLILVTVVTWRFLYIKHQQLNTVCSLWHSERQKKGRVTHGLLASLGLDLYTKSFLPVMSNTDTAAVLNILPKPLSGSLYTGCSLSSTLPRIPMTSLTFSGGVIFPKFSALRAASLVTVSLKLSMYL